MDNLDAPQNNDQGSSLLAGMNHILAAGWRLVPTHGIVDGKCTCKKKHDKDSAAGKHPLHTKYKEEATSDLEDIKNWITTDPNINLAVLCKESGLMVIDVDPRNGGDESLLKLEEFLGGSLPVTVQAKTGVYLAKGTFTRGRHFYFRAEPGEHFYGSFPSLDLPGIDIKHNGHVMLPPSKHLTGENYEWVEGFEPWSIPIARPSQAMLELLLKGEHDKDSSPPPDIDEETLTSRLTCEVTATAYAKRALEFEAAEVASLRQGDSRNSALHESANAMGHLIGDGQISAQEVIVALTVAARVAFAGEEAEEEIASVLRLRGGPLEAGARYPRTYPAIPSFY